MHVYTEYSLSPPAGRKEAALQPEEQSLCWAETCRGSKGNRAWLEVKCGCEQCSYLYLHCTFTVHTGISVYVLLCTMLGWKWWFWKDLQSVCDSMCLGDVYSNAPTIVYCFGVVNILLSFGSCTYMYVHACPSICRDVHICACMSICTMYICVCIILPNHVHGSRIPDGHFMQILNWYHNQTYVILRADIINQSCDHNCINQSYDDIPTTMVSQYLYMIGLLKGLVTYIHRPIL